MDAEDDRLRAAVAQHGTKWPVVSKQVETRTSDQCSKRWKQVLDPNLDHSPWTLEEVSQILISTSYACSKLIGLFDRTIAFSLALSSMGEIGKYYLSCTSKIGPHYL